MTFKLALSFAFAVLSYAVLPIQASAFPLPKGPLSALQIPSTFTTHYDFEGIVALSNCSGSLIRFESSKDSDAAVILTNGHCYEYGMPDPGEVLSHQESDRSFTVLGPDASSLGRVHATQLIYSSMTKTDITLYRLSETYAQILADFHVRPFTLSSERPAIGTPIEVISGYWRRGYTCSVEFFAHELDEGGYKMFESLRYSRPGCEVIGGTSGSPVIAKGTRTVVAINNTGNEDGRRCTMNNPCEIDEQGNVTFTKGYTYAQQTYWIYSCLNESNDLDLNKAGCLLAH